MKHVFLALTFVTFGSMACNRVQLEESPEALVGYGLPSQHSNFDKSTPADKSLDKSLSWFQSSAVHTKLRVNE
jgi:hypothetical protein